MKCSVFHKWNIGQNATEIYQPSKQNMKCDGLMYLMRRLLFWGHCLLMQNNEPNISSWGGVGEETKGGSPPTQLALRARLAFASFRLKYAKKITAVLQARKIMGF